MCPSGRFLTCLVAFLAVACEPKSPTGGGPATPMSEAFPVRFNWAPAERAVEDAEFVTTMTAHSKVRSNGKEQAVNLEQGYEFSFSEQTLKLDGRVPTFAARRFKKASTTLAGQTERLAVEGQDVSGEASPGGGMTWTIIGGESLRDRDHAAMSEGLGRRGGGGLDGCVVVEEFGSGRAVKPGDSWHPDAATIAKLYVDPSMQIDPSASRLTCTLDSAEKRDGAIYGAINLNFDFAVLKVGGGVLSEPLHFVLEGKVSGCLDGSTSDARLSATIKMKGTRKVARPGVEESLEVDYDLVIALRFWRALLPPVR
jgi:hypothetical protein